MKEVLLGVVIGVFLGAAAFEIVNRANPKVIKDTEEKAKKMVDSFVGSFKEGYTKANA